MCGILAVLGIKSPGGAHAFRATALKLSKRLRHRGPDWNGIFVHEDSIIAHERLAIVDVESGAQPLISADGSLVLAVNGEIYNHEIIRHSYPQSRCICDSDCAVILAMFEESGLSDAANVLNRLRGMFAFVIFDTKSNRFLAARDHIGIIPFYMGWGIDGSVWFASELKALADHCTTFQHFPPGYFYDSAHIGDKLRPFYKPEWLYSSLVPKLDCPLSLLRESLIKSVEAHLMADVPFGVLLSGGLDSSLIASIAARILCSRSNSPKSAVSSWPSRLPSFTVGLKGSPDLDAAKRVAEFLGTSHRSFLFTVQDGLDALPDVIYHLETYDVTTVRASTPMYLMSRLIKASGVKMVLSGEGADEVFGGYLYFHKAPSAQEFHEECQRKIRALHMYDCLRANKATSAFGVEARVPFLDKEFLDVAMNIDPSRKMCQDEISQKPRCEKHILRAAFDTPENPFLPADILWRQKEQFSDGVGYGWIDALKDHAEAHVTDAMMDSVQYRFPDNTPTSKEAYLYRQIFEGHFPQPSAHKTVPGGPSVACSSASAIAWDKSFQSSADPSGRAVSGVHVAAYAPVKEDENKFSKGA